MADGRDANGRFVKGHKHSVGNKGGRPKKAREQRYYEIMCRTVTFKDWEVVCKTALARAKAGDKDARKFLAEYLMGKPELTLNLAGGTDNRLVIEYVNDWRENQTT